MNTKEKIKHLYSWWIPFVITRKHARQKHAVDVYQISLFICLLSIACFGGGESAVEAQRTAPPKKTPPVELISPNGLALDKEGTLYISDIGAHRIFKLGHSGKLTVIAGTGREGFSGDGGPAINAQLRAPHDLLFDATGNLLIADTGNQRIRRIDRQGVIRTLSASLNNPQGIALDREGNLLIADTYNHLIRSLDPNGLMTTIAGTAPGYGGDGGQAARAQINLPMAVAVGPDRSIYLSDAANSRIRRIEPGGVIRTIVGFGPAQDTYGGGFAGDGGPAEKAKIFSATDLKFDAAGNLYICDSGNHRIRVIRNGVITTIAGGDPGKAGAAELNTPQKLAVAPDGSIFISDRANGRVRKVDTKGLISTIVGRRTRQD